MVGYDINHYPDSLIVGGFDEILEVLVGTKVRVSLGPVLCPVAVVASINVVNDRRDPNGIESKVLDIVKFVNSSLIVASTVIAERGAVVTGVGIGKSIGQELINVPFFPIVGVTGESSGSKSEYSRVLKHIYYNSIFDESFYIALLYT